jgi:hypothetical protein
MDEQVNILLNRSTKRGRTGAFAEHIHSGGFAASITQNISFDSATIMYS